MKKMFSVAALSAVTALSAAPAQAGLINLNIGGGLGDALGDLLGSNPVTGNVADITLGDGSSTGLLGGTSIDLSSPDALADVHVGGDLGDSLGGLLGSNPVSGNVADVTLGDTTGGGLVGDALDTVGGIAEDVPGLVEDTVGTVGDVVESVPGFVDDTVGTVGGLVDGVAGTVGDALGGTVLDIDVDLGDLAQATVTVGGPTVLDADISLLGDEVTALATVGGDNGLLDADVDILPNQGALLAEIDADLGSTLGIANVCIGNACSVPMISAVPEPSTYALMLGGIGMVGFMAMRRKKADAAKA